MNSKVVYFPGLNGLRAIAAIAVVISHITLSLKDFNLSPYIFGSFKDGQPIGLLLAGYGVSIFFVLSGFLITYLLQTEKDLHPIDIKKFYFRRILRIWPLYYLYLMLSIGCIIYFKLYFNIKALFLYIFYAANVPFILGKGLPFLVHYWSLGVEEQFYLFWPWFNKKINKLITPIIVMIILLAGTKVALHFLYPNSLFELAIHVTRFHCMMIGGLGALLYKNNNKLFLQIVDNKFSQFICWIIMLLIAINRFHAFSVIDDEIISVVALFLIVGQIQVKNRLINLELGIFNFLGKISYGIYVTHLLLIFLFSKLLMGLDTELHYKYFIVYFSILSATIIVSYISYTYFESWFLKLKEKFAVIHSSATKL